MRCANPAHGTFAADDGPSIYYDAGGTDLYAASADSDPRGGCADGSAQCNRLYIFRNCNAGQPGGASCPLTSTVGLRLGSPSNHPVVRTNPATHNAMVAYKDSSNMIRLAFYTPTGTLVKDFVAGGPYPAGPVSDCTSSGCENDSSVSPYVPKCGPNADGTGGCTTADCGVDVDGHGRCMRMADKVNLATRFVGMSYAYLTWNYTCPTASPDGRKHMKQYLRIFDVTTESAPVQVKNLVSGTCAASNDTDFESTFVASSIANAYAWGYYKQLGGNPCDTRFYVAASTSATIASWTGAWYADSFGKTILGLNTVGLTDYIGGTETATTAKPIFFAYARPVAGTSGTCVSCKGTQYGVALYGVKVTP
jgi:hypothetical protein